MKKILLTLAVLSLSVTALGESAETEGNSRANLGSSFMQAFGMAEAEIIVQDSDTGENAPGIGGRGGGRGPIFIPKSHSFRTSRPFTPYSYGNN